MPSGLKVCLKKDQRLVVDTHVIADAAAAWERNTQDDAYRLFDRIAEVCPKVCLTPKQIRDELPQALRKRGLGRRITQLQLGKYLESMGKLLRPRGVALADEEALVLRGEGHVDVTDDAHLFETAKGLDHVVVTKDQHVLAKRRQIRDALGVETMSVGEALGLAPQGSPDEQGDA